MLKTSECSNAKLPRTRLQGLPKERKTQTRWKTAKPVLAKCCSLRRMSIFLLSCGRLQTIQAHENEASSGLMCRGKGEPQQSTGPWIHETLHTARNYVQFKHLFSDNNVSVIQEGWLFMADDVHFWDILISSLQWMNMWSFLWSKEVWSWQLSPLILQFTVY